MDIRNHDELLKKQATLEAYLLKNPQSKLFAWYARQNMEAGELNRALSICLLGIQNVESRGVLHKLMGEIYLAKGEVTNAMKQMIECVLTKEPFPGVIIEVIKNLGDTMEPQQVAFLIYLLNKALPGHPDAVQFYKKFPNSRNYVVQPGEYQFLEDLAVGLERSALVEVMPLDEDEENPLALPDSVPPEMEYTAPEPVQKTVPQPPPQAAPQAPPEPAPEVPPVQDFAYEAEPEIKAEPPVPEYEIPDTTPPLKEVLKQTENMTDFDENPVSHPPRQAPPQDSPPAPKKPAIKHNINRSMATFTLMEIFKDQGMYENALEVLTFLREKSSDIERIDREEKEIRALLAGNGSK
ncbi:MAG: hypothetical protein K9M55_02735 [Candidatus Marinimicrobia bacterium]|nr:hypothetical protein [Candidatus Neomarinimicrobiota bacterium]MCF7921596.1 hypothetical protein [Candidatus Neomarinimicrobiota bacterium]